eukprot:5590911-Amphidinium_carterae.1
MRSAQGSTWWHQVWSQEQTLSIRECGSRWQWPSTEFIPQLVSGGSFSLRQKFTDREYSGAWRHLNYIPNQGTMLPVRSRGPSDRNVPVQGLWRKGGVSLPFMMPTKPLPIAK